MNKVSRISITLPSQLHRDLDSMVREAGYPNRSKAIQDALTVLLAEHKWLRGEKGDKVGVLVAIYNHDKPGIIKNLIDIQHEYRMEIISSMHVHLDASICLETISLRGDAQRLRSLVEEFKIRKGVKEVKLITVVPE